MVIFRKTLTKGIVYTPQASANLNLLFLICAIVIHRAETL